jgi:hypothetical protein
VFLNIALERETKKKKSPLLFLRNKRYTKFEIKKKKKKKKKKIKMIFILKQKLK